MFSFVVMICSYGDVVPITPLGKLISGLTMLSGILVIALPITVLGSNFQDVYQVYKKSHRNKLKKIQPNTIQIKTHINKIKEVNNNKSDV